jgi:carbon storage regulator
MLVLNRKVNEQIRIGDDIVITVARLRGDSVYVGVDAPKDVPVLRAELVEREREETRKQ